MALGGAVSSWKLGCGPALVEAWRRWGQGLRVRGRSGGADVKHDRGRVSVCMYTVLCLPECAACVFSHQHSGGTPLFVAGL